jgi:HPt (histidine-containing phosphotransfer) domain-containing protein
MSHFTRTPAGAAPVEPHALRDTTWTVESLRSVWQRQQGHVSERIDLVGRAVAALEEGHLDPKLSSDATRAAHMLAGSLGMFGFLEAGEAARELEQGLADPGVDHVPELARALARLRAGVRGPVSVRWPSPVAQR